jgi:hypothetical protein
LRFQPCTTLHQITNATDTTTDTGFKRDFAGCLSDLAGNMLNMAADLESVLTHLGKLSPPTLYHYTSLDVLQKIVERGIIWASDVRYLNDSTEYSHVIDIISSRVEEHLLTAEGSKTEALKELNLLLRMGSTNDLFVSCFSTRRDDLSQWRGYCPSGIGACIGFNSEALKRVIAPKTIPAGNVGLLSEVMYISKDFAPRFDEIIDIAVQMKPDESLNVTGPSAVYTILNLLAPFYKDVSFSEEEEWRILFNSNVELGTKFRQGKSMLIPYKEVDLKTHFSQFITEVIIGPSPNMRLSVNATKKLLQVNKMDHVVVDESRVPYRHW